MADDPDERRIWRDEQRVAVGKERRRSNPQGVPVMEFEGPATGVLSGSDLDAARARRPTDERLHRLETSRDGIVKDMGEVKGKLGELKGQLDGQDRVLGSIQQSITNLSAREHVTFTAKVDVDKRKALEQVEAGADKRKLITKAAAAVIGVLAAAGGALAHYIAGGG